VLASLGINLEEARGRVEGIIERDARQEAAEVGMTPRARKVIELAVKEAFQMKHHYIGTEHLLLGLVREGDGSADSVLATLGANDLTLKRMRARTRQVLAARRPMRRGWRWLPWRRGGGRE
jgi:ATP-dependent Clp protease ATP-binding subunit ClpC